MTVRELRHGEGGGDVRALQETLLHLGYTEIGTPDGDFGEHTDAAVKRFQADNGLDQSGVVDDTTRAQIVAMATMYGVAHLMTEEGRDAVQDANALAHGEAPHQQAHAGAGTVQMPDGATLSEDGHWWWDGSDWQPVPKDHPGTPAAPVEPAGSVDDLGLHAAVTADTHASFGADLTSGDLVMRRLLDIGDHYGSLRDPEAKRILDKVAAANAQAQKVAEVLDQLHYIEDVQQPRQLETVRQGGVDIAKRAKRDPNLRKAVEGYTEESPELRAQVDKLEAAHKRVVAASKGLEVAVATKQLRSAGTAVQDAQGKVAEIEAKAATLRERVGKVIDTAELLIGDPKKYKDVVEDAAKYLKGKAIDFLLGDVYAAELAEAQAALAAAKKHVEEITAKIELTNIEKATAELEGAQKDYDASLQQLVAATRKAESSEGDLIQRLEGLGGGADQVATAIEARAETAALAAKAKPLVATYLAECDVIQKDGHTLRSKYEDYATGIQRVQLEWNQLQLREELHDRAQNNMNVLDKIMAHAAAEKAIALDAQKYLEAATYLKAYEDMEQTLHRALNDV